ncbi:MAG: aspartate-semialdehyde dehydrogenase [Acidimicrobiales bacterium]
MRVGVFGATGQVGAVMRSVLQERGFPVDSVRFFGSSRSAGSRLPWGGGEIEVEAAEGSDYSGIDIALCSMGAPASRTLAPLIAAGGAVVVDNSSAWRMDPDVPLVVPEVNVSALGRIGKGIVANPNCTTMVCMPALAALDRAAGLRRVVAATYQAVSGAGRDGVGELAEQVSRAGARAPELAFDGRAVDLGQPVRFARSIAFNVLPLAGKLVDDETDEEHKLRDESRKILGLPQLPVSATCVRVPVFSGHGVALHVALARPMTPGEARDVLGDAPGVQLSEVPTPLQATGEDACFVGRIRQDPDEPTCVSLFVAGDNLRKGAALNAVQIAEALLGRLARGSV